MKAVEEEVEQRMVKLIRDWTIYVALKELNGCLVPRIGLTSRRR
jgi:hypothetical protein